MTKEKKTNWFTAPPTILPGVIMTSIGTLNVVNGGLQQNWFPLTIGVTYLSYALWRERQRLGLREKTRRE